MGWYEFIIANKELLKIAYALIVVIICAAIVFRTDKLFRVSSYKGIQYLRNAFLFYGIGFALRYFFSFLLVQEVLPGYFYFIDELFEYFLIMGGFFLLYSLLWKRIEPPGLEYTSSLLNTRVAIFHLMALMIVVLDVLWGGYFFMFASQIIVFALASIISIVNYRKKDKKYKFSKFYFLAVLLGFFAWLLNAVAELYFSWNQGIVINIYILNLIFFLLFLYGVFRITKSK